MKRLRKCSECGYSDPTNLDRLTNKPFCSNWKQHLDCGCFYGIVEGYPDAEEGDIYYNPMFHDFWIVKDNLFHLMSDNFTIGLDEPVGFIKVGHIDLKKVRT